jgi:hypothetical protein
MLHYIHSFAPGCCFTCTQARTHTHTAGGKLKITVRVMQVGLVAYGKSVHQVNLPASYSSNTILVVVFCITGHPGRPKVEILRDQLLFL